MLFEKKEEEKCWSFTLFFASAHLCLRLSLYRCRIHYFPCPVVSGFVFSVYLRGRSKSWIKANKQCFSLFIVMKTEISCCISSMKAVCLSVIWRIRNISEVQLRPCFFLKILLKAFLLRLLDDSVSSPPSSSTGLLLAGTWSPVPRLVPEELDEAEDKKATGLSVMSDVMHRERVEEEEASPEAELALSSPRLELFSRPPPPISPEPWAWRVWTLDVRKGLDTYKLRGSLWDIGREESESERSMMSLREKERNTVDDNSLMIKVRVTNMQHTKKKILHLLHAGSTSRMLLPEK